jgi:hypothetical protein
MDFFVQLVMLGGKLHHINSTSIRNSERDMHCTEDQRHMNTLENKLNEKPEQISPLCRPVQPSDCKKYYWIEKIRIEEQNLQPVQVIKVSFCMYIP